MKCPHCGNEINVGALIGSVKSKAKTRAARENAKLGGWPKGKKRGKRKRPQDPNALAHSVVADAIKRTEQPPQPQASRQSRRGSKRGPTGQPPSRE
jgi:hypothetical protein